MYDVWDPSGCYYPGVTGSNLGCIYPDLCLSSRSSISSSSSSISSSSSCSSIGSIGSSSLSSESSGSSRSSSSIVNVQGYELCANESIDFKTGLESEILISTPNVGEMFLATDTNRLLIYDGNGIFTVFDNELGIQYKTDTYANIHAQSPPAPRGAIFLATDTRQLIISDGGGVYVVLNTEPLGYYCAFGFSADFDTVNGSYVLMRDPQGVALSYNGYAYYQNENKVTLFYTGESWAFDLTENNEVTIDFIEKPEDSITPEGSYYVSGQSSFYGQVIEGVCQERSSSSSSGTELITVFSGSTTSINQTQNNTYEIHIASGETVNFATDSGDSFELTSGNGGILIVDQSGAWSGPFFLSIGDDVVLDLNGEFYYLRYSGVGSFIVVIKGIKFIVYTVA